ncbi:alpha/beta hydrolase [Mesorhizobium xinjiangense]|uniref:alpha/beta hydrolase n=1 Tax=Mesorhizobium xinjiangense TaxID=2678685 RepID=UPI0012EE3621|nr:alpha/beta-hydrolase family protein [Mesorhizobium xinjiangense]
MILEKSGTWIERNFSVVGLLVGSLFFAASLTPSLLPRGYAMQGILSGCLFAAGYGIGVLGSVLWRFLELPQPSQRVWRNLVLISAMVCAAVAFAFLWRASGWQNSIRDLMHLERVETARPYYVGMIALAVALVLIGLGRLFAFVFRLLTRWLDRFVPRRVAQVVGAAIAIWLFALVIDGVIFRYALRAADSSFARMDALIDDGMEQPTDPLKTGSSQSLIDWDSVGRRGSEFIANGPDKQEIATFLGRPALEPIRVYVGLRSADTTKAQARLALEELKRVGAFERSALVIAIPTGTGWLDPAGMDTLDYLHGGDVASVAIQYSYLTSWLSLLVEPGYGAEAAQALFAEVYDHWTSLPEDERPKLYLYGLSLGAMNSQLSAELFDVIGDPFDGALWAGPPFTSRLWNHITASRNEDSPFWLPRYRDGSLFRFANQQTEVLDIPGAEWGPMRIVYLQYGSDPVVFFDPYAAYREPQWMRGERGPDVSDELRWYPIVTVLQLALDLAMATTSPIGYGHVYAPDHYIDAWMQVMQPDGWSAADIARLKEEFADFGQN